MKILILGTSNSILVGGWVAGFKQAYPDAEVQNASIGASPGLQFAYWLDKSIEAYDLVIFDSIINDEYLLKYIGTKAYQDQLMFEILSTLASRTKLVVLGFSRRKHRTADSDEYKSRKIISKKVGAQFVGFHDMVVH
jgi:hypothetical protein